MTDLIDGGHNYREVLREDPKWMKLGACVGSDVNNFFIEFGSTHNYKAVIENFCNVCSVKQSCLQYALDNHAVGIWGGTTNRGRRNLRREKVA
jgi:hypothetical protein